MMRDLMQQWLYEAYAPVFGQMAAALISGFAVVIDGEVRLTPSGERYIQRFDEGRK
jgi:hypothetical protein